ncbi:MFS transporter [Streptomyces sp. NBC_00250]|uniref:MFS transporter n=1 Tax=Streptomyces sp. NBC_00250 TaxID=2903641 RepID=UPI002E28455F|nr:MFS transporter [Streptomyces sp. NBC_00250]
MSVSLRAPRTPAWASRPFLYLLASESTSLAGSAVSTIALAAVAVLELHATTTEVALIAFVGQLPSSFALWAGVLSDRYDKRRQLLGSDLAAAGALLTVPVAAVADLLTIGQLYVVLFLLGSAKVVHDAAAISLLPSVVAPERLQNANSRLGAASSVADSAGSNAGAALVGAVGPAVAILADVASFVVSAVLVSRMRPAQPLVPSDAEQRGLGQGIVEGVRYVLGQPTIRTVIAALSVLSFGLAIMNTYWAFYLLTTIGISPTSLGMIVGVGGVGSLAGALLAPRIAARIGIGPTIIAGFATSPIAQLPLLFAGPGPGWQIALAAALAGQLFWATAAGTSQRSLRQTLCDPRFQGRMQAASTTVTAGGRPLAAATAGALALVLDVPTVLALGALLQIVPVLLLLTSPVRALRTMPAPAVLPHAREGAS